MCEKKEKKKIYIYHPIGQNVPGVDLEDQGGSGSASSHWERATLHNEIMGASNLPDEAFSSFSLALLEDSGWYQVDYTLSVSSILYNKRLKW